MSDTNHAALVRWLNDRVEYWRHLDRVLEVPAPRRNRDDVFALMQSYRRLARDLALARRELPGSGTTRALEGLYRRVHAEIHNQPGSWRDDLKTLFTRRIPAATMRMLPDLWVITAIFFGTALGAAICVIAWPQTTELILPPSAMMQVEQGELWTDSLFTLAPAAQLSFGIMANNIMVALTAIALGLFFGFGTLYITTVNGAMLGAVFAFTGLHGLAANLGRFVVAHGIVEISVILVAAAIGSRLGRALARPGVLGRAAALREESRALTPLLAVVIPALIGCGIIEGYVSPNPAYDWLPRIVIGVAWMVIFVLALTGLGRMRASHPVASA